MIKEICKTIPIFIYIHKGLKLPNCFGNIFTCLMPEPRLPPVKSMERSDVTVPPPPKPPSVLRIVDLIAVSISPYVFAFPCSIAWIKEKVIAPVEVTFDRACPRSVQLAFFEYHSMMRQLYILVNLDNQYNVLKIRTDVSAEV